MQSLGVIKDGNGFPIDAIDDVAALKYHVIAFPLVV